MNSRNKFLLPVLGAVSFFIVWLMAAVWMGSELTGAILPAVIGAAGFGVVMFLLLRFRRQPNG